MYFLGFSRYSNCVLVSVETKKKKNVADAAQLTYQGVLVPGDALLLVGVGVGETVDLAGLTTEESVELGTDLVALASLQGVALSASGLEKVGTLLNVACWHHVSVAASDVWSICPELCRLPTSKIFPCNVSGCCADNCIQGKWMREVKHNDPKEPL